MSRVEVEKVHTITGHNDCVYSLSHGPVPHQFFSGAGDGMVAAWDLQRPNQGELVARLPFSVYALHLLDDDTLVVGHNYDGIHLLNWREKKEMGSLKITKSAIFDIQSLGDHLVIADGDGVITIVDAASLEIKRKLEYAGKSARTIAINPVLGDIAIGYSDHHIRIFDIETFQLKKEWRAHDNSVFSLAYTPNGEILLSGSRDAHLKGWQATHNYELVYDVVAHLYAINDIVFSPEGKHFVTCSMDKSIKVWDTAEMKLLKVIDKARHAGHGTSVNKMIWTSFNDQLISGSDDRSISVWKLFFNLKKTTHENHTT